LARLTPERAGWSAAPEVSIGLARQKEACDEIVAQIRAGNFQQYYSYAFGKIERVWDYVCAVAKRSQREKQVEETNKVKAELYAALNEFNTLINSPEDLNILEDQRIRRINKLDGLIIAGFVAFYQQTLDLGVEVGMFSYQKGGDWYPEKSERGRGVPFLPG
jgi:hypothetical protein